MASNGAKSVILGGARTPMAEWVGGKTGAGKPGGRLKDVSANELGAIAARAALERTGVAPAEVDHVVSPTTFFVLQFVNSSEQVGGEPLHATLRRAFFLAGASTARFGAAAARAGPGSK